MRKKQKTKLLDILIVVFIATLVGMIAGGATLFSMYYEKNSNSSNINYSNLGEISELYKKILDEYYDEIDEDILVEGAISGMLSVLDTNSSYLNQSDTTNFNNKMKGEYYGIGIEALTLENVGILVVTVLPNSPSEKAGIKDGDIIVSINGKELKDKTATYFTTLVGSIKNDIELTVMRNEKSMNFILSAEKVIIESVTRNIFYKNYKQIGYIKIDIFAANTASQFTTKLKELEESGIDSLIIDVRDNAGGYLSSVSTILELFMNKDDILYKIENKQKVTERKDNTNDSRDYPIAVLINGSSASASEVLATSLKDNKQSELIGETSYGKGTVQETVNVLDGGMAKITTKKWLTPNGEWINEVGITPTVTVKLSENYLKNPTYDNDNQLEKAINVISNK